MGRGIGAALSILLIPVYIRFLGVEAYGLVGFFLVLQTVVSVLDLGLSTTTNREIALRVVDEERRGETRDLLRTIEAIYWPIGIVIGWILIAFAPLIASRWLHPQALSVGTIETSIRLMGVTAALQWPYSVYEGVFHGLQRIVAFNAVAAGMQIVRALGAVLVVWYRPTITAFFVWQLVVSAMTAALLAIFSWRFMPSGPRPRVRLALVHDVWRFAAGMTATVALGVILSESDRIVLSRILSLERFGYYSVAKTVATGLMYLMAPISLTMLPRYTELLARNEPAQLARTYHLSAQLMTVVVTPVALVIAFFSRDLLAIWTRSDRIADRASMLLTVLATAILLKALTEVPYIMQLSQGLAKLAAYTNLASVALYVPLLAILAARYGAMGAALAMLGLHGAKFLIWGQVVHAHILPAEKWRWYFIDVLRPAMAAVTVVAIARLLIPRSFFVPVLSGLALLGMIVATAGVAAVAVAPLARSRAEALVPLFRQFVTGRGSKPVV